MATAKGKKDEKKGADKGVAKKLKKTSRRYKNYEVSGEKVTRKNQPCPKCGTGIFLAAHKDRQTCGKCSYMQKKTAPKKE